MAIVNIRVVGIYMNEQVDVSLDPSTTVRDVMKAYERKNPLSQSGGFSITDSPPRSPNAPPQALSPTTMSYRLGNGKTTKGQRNIPPGVYTLSEPKNFSFTDRLFNAFDAFQYYVEEDVPVEGRSRPATFNKSKGGGFTYYNQTGNYEIKEGDTILWRQVSIKLQPDFRPPLDIPPPLQNLDPDVLRQFLQMRQMNAVSDDQFQKIVSDLQEGDPPAMVANRVRELIAESMED